MSRRLLPVFFGLFLFAASPPARATEVEFVRIWPAWRTAESFDRISEYFDGQENTGRHTVLRSQPDTRAGYYFLVRTKTTLNAADAKFVLQIIKPDAPQAKTYTFPVVLIGREVVFNLGLTGTDWPDRKTHAVAWRLALVSGKGEELASRESFLWAKSAP
jgi:hypothetical protein